jgi:hypothetical protein
LRELLLELLLSEDELLSFSEICMDSTLVFLKVKRELPSSTGSANYDCYALALQTTEFDLEEINVPFVPTLRELETNTDPSHRQPVV